MTIKKTTEKTVGDRLVRVDAGENSSRYMTYCYIKRPAPATAERIKYWIGAVADWKLKDAAKEVEIAHGHAAAGRDPRVEREKLLADELVKRNRTNGPTFIEYARERHAKWKAEWKSEEHAAKWIASLENHCAPIANMQLAAIRSADVVACIEPIWQTHNIAAQDLLGRIRRVLSAAVGTHRAEGVPNPAAMTEAMKDNLGKPVTRGMNSHPSMDYSDLPAFMVELQARREHEARMIETVILTCLRSGEVRQMRKSWLDLDAAVMTVPKEMLKVPHGNDLPVPLCSRLIEIFQERIEVLDRLIGEDEDYFIWAGHKLDAPVNDDAMRLFLRDEMGIDPNDATVHGMRATFSTWADAKLLVTGAQLANESAVEWCMAHSSGTKKKGGVKVTLRSKSTQAYKRETMFEARVPIMQMWTDHCLPPAATKRNVVKLRAA